MDDKELRKELARELKGGVKSFLFSKEFTPRYFRYSYTFYVAIWLLVPLLQKQGNILLFIAGLPLLLLSSFGAWWFAIGLGFILTKGTKYENTPEEFLNSNQLRFALSLLGGNLLVLAGGLVASLVEKG